VPPEGGRGALVPRRFRDAYASGEMTIEDIRAENPRNPRPQYTARGQEAAEAFEMWNPDHNPRLRCEPTSIVYDWTFDWPVNRITQEDDRIVIDYGLYSITRIIHLDPNATPSAPLPNNTGHSIGHWEDNTLVVNSYGFSEGVVSPPTRNSTEMTVEERFTIDTDDWELTRQWTVTDPVYLAEPWTGQDKVYLSEVPFERNECLELTPEFSE
jgi:hypothetical protein